MANPFESHAPISPSVPADVLLAELERRYGVTGRGRPLGSHQDQNLLVEDDAGRRLLVKVANAGYPEQEIEAQDHAMTLVAAAGLPFAVPVPVPALDGSLRFTIDDRGVPCIARVLTWIEGEPLAGCGHLAAPVLEAIGEVAGRLTVALAGLEHPGIDRVIQWDSRRAVEVVEGLSALLAPDERRVRAAASAVSAIAATAPLAPSLRSQAVHCDVTTWNVVGRRDAAGRLMPVGVIDFGDLVRSWIAADVATAVAGTLEHARGRVLQAASAVVRGYDRVLPLNDDEIAAIWPLVRARAALCGVSSDRQLSLEPDNAYVAETSEAEWRTFEEADGVPDALAEETLRLALGRGPSARAAATRAAVAATVPVIAVPAGARVLDLSTTTAVLEPGAWADAGALRAAVDAAVGAGACLGRHGEARLHRALPGVEEPASVHLGVDVVVPAGTPVVAPAAGRVATVGAGSLTLSVHGFDLQLGGIDPAVPAGAAVAAGDALGVVGATAADAPLPSHLHVQASRPGIVAPALVPPSAAAAWLEVSPDPSVLVGLPAGALVVTAPDPAVLLARRDAVLASAQERYYAASPRIERGWRHHLYSTDGRAYLDMVNNVAGIGHSHPALAAAVGRQLRLLNTNSRFNYGLIVEYAERLTALLPDPLDTVFLVSTGSEAVDLALRLARIVTGAEDVLSVQSAYHGWTVATDAISTALYDNPRALETRPSWVHTVESPNTFRGRFRGADAGARYAEDVARAVGEVTAAGRGVAAFIAEPLYGNAGGVELPDGYLAEAYRLVRGAGGLAIADEVQVGLGRTGEALWAFQREGVLPDVVTVAKSAGNGVGLGAVITRRELAERFRDEGSFFSSVGGSPVSCAAGIAVLDAIRDEGLQENARVVGAHLKARLAALAERHPLVGAAHGVGLYLGLELVRDRETLEPATEECYAICDRLLDLGIVVQPTSDSMNVLKVKPPLCLDLASADRFADAVDRVLGEGW